MRRPRAGRIAVPWRSLLGPRAGSALRLPLLGTCLLAVLAGGCGRGEPAASDAAGAAGAAVLPRDAVCAHAPDALGEMEHGYAVPAEGNGRMQSPIDIHTAQVTPGEHEISIHYGPSREHIRNLGHTVQLDYDPGSFVRFDDHVYDFAQFHFHTPSEHLVDGMTFPLEMHMVHTMRDDASEVPHYLVIGVLFKDGAPNPFLARFIDLIPAAEHASADIEDTFVDASELLGGDWCDFFHYTGSLTTPPFTETVEWIVLRKVFEASHEQIETLNRLEGNNARHIQAYYGREIDVYSRGH